MVRGLHHKPLIVALALPSSIAIQFISPPLELSRNSVADSNYAVVVATVAK
jgi:hypothetical protein